MNILLYLCSMIYYIYTLTDPITNQIRYIGKTVNLKRRYTSHSSIKENIKENTHRSKWVLSLLNKGLKPIMHVIDQTNHDWQKLEKFYIQKYKNEGFDLCNLTLGGDGGTGHSKYKEFIIYQFDKNGQLINEFQNTKIAAKQSNTSFENIKRCIRGTYKTAGGFYWSKEKNFKSKNRNHNAKYVYQYDLNGNFIKKFNSVYEAAKETNIQRNSIKNCCHGKQKRAGKYQWKFE